MKAVTWQGRSDMQVIDVPDPVIEEPTDVVIDVTSSGLCGSDLHLYDPLTPFMTPGDIVGHEPMGIVREVGSAVETLEVGDRVVVPFNISCGSCWMCDRGLFSQCETTQNTDTGTGASLFGYSKLYGQVPGGQAEMLRVPFGDMLPIKVPHGPPDDRFLFLSDVLPTAWQAVEYADVEEGGTLLVVGAILMLLVGMFAPASFLSHFIVFVLSVFIGFQVIWNVSHSLHTPLMAITNAISSIIIVGALLQIGSGSWLVVLLAALSVLMAGVNIFGGFLVTRRMLAMFQKS